MTNASNTFDRSCEHWSEIGRREMENFYALASLDYQHLAQEHNWKVWLENRQKLAGSRRLRLLDVACGSGKFPEALISYAGVANAEIKPIDYALLDPSGFSISEARQSLASPFEAGTEYQMTLQDLDCYPGSFDIAWAAHALYAIPAGELKVAIDRMVHATGCDGVAGAGFIAHARSDSHYLKFFQHYLSGFKGGIGVPYSSSEQIIKTLKQLELQFEAKEINYINTAPKAKETQVEGYLQRCLFDDTISLKEMLDNPKTGPYLKSCRKNNTWQFKQHVTMIFINPSKLAGLSMN